MSGKRLKAIVAARNATIVPGAPNAMFARVIEDLGFETVYISGAGIANMHLGAPDIGLVTMSEIQNVVASVSDAVSIPIIVDIDTGFGNPLNTIRTVRALERAGAAGLQIEDQIFPKRCGHFSGKEVVPVDEIVQKNPRRGGHAHRSEPADHRPDRFARRARDRRRHRARAPVRRSRCRRDLH